jgi:Zn ribbon nucleic-acid-binding protein
MPREHILKTGGSLEEVDIRCPKCNSNNITVYWDEKEGYYDVLECKACGYKKSFNKSS